MDFQTRKDSISRLVDNILDSYKREKDIAPHDACPMPNRDIIIELSKKLRILIFPGYFDKCVCAKDIMEYRTGELIITIHDELTEQIIFALCLEQMRQNNNKGENCKKEDLRERAAELSLQFLSKIPSIREYIATDVQAALDGDPAASSKDEIIYSYPGVFAITMHRLAHELYLLNIPLIPRILSEYSHSITGIDIHAGAVIGKYFFIDHGTGVVIGETTNIGENVKIYQGVTLGALSTRGGQKLRGVKRHPTIEDGVTIYSGASVLGGDTVIGEGSTIGSNAFITETIQKDTKVSIRTPELILKNGSSGKLSQEFI